MQSSNMSVKWDAKSTSTKAMFTSRTAVAFVLLFSVGACASLKEAKCKSGEQLAVQDTLYFGTGKPNGVVTRQEWTKFLEAAVTPRFPKGFTVSETSGQWRGADGSLVRESTYVLYLVHPNEGPTEKLVTDIISLYKAQFQQEAVLRVKASACVSF